MRTSNTTERSGGRPEGAAADEIRTRLRGMWASVATAWGEHAEYADARGAALTEHMLQLSTPRPGERVLDLACGPGGLGLAAAEEVAPRGEVVLSDIVAEMTTIAAARADALGLRNVTTRVLDIERIEQPDQSYDLVLCREGPFSLEDSGKLAALFSDAELSDITIGELPVPTRAASFEEWWTRTCALAGPLTNILASLPEDGAQGLRARARKAASAYQTPTGLEFPGVTLIATGHRA